MKLLLTKSYNTKFPCGSYVHQRWQVCQKSLKYRHLVISVESWLEEGRRVVQGRGTASQTFYL
jgi:hypothetical protein